MEQERLRLSELGGIVLDYVLKHSPASKADICLGTGKSISAVTRYLQELCDAGLIVERGIGDSSGGRKPVLYAVNARRWFICCVNVSTIYCEVAIVDLSLEVLCFDRFDIQAEDRPSDIVAQIGRLYETQRLRCGLAEDQFLGAGVSVFSSVRNEQGVLYPPIIRYMDPLWEEYPLVPQLARQLRLPLYVEKGINAAAMLEYHYGRARGSAKSIYVLCAMNLRAAVIQDGRIACSSPFYEDAFGHMTIDFDGPRCPCGRYGCINCYANIPAILTAFRRGVKQSGRGSPLYDHADELDIYAVCRAASDGDEAAVRAIQQAADLLGIALANFINLIGPDTVILDGLLPHESRLYYERAVLSAKTRLMSTSPVLFEREGRFGNTITIGAAAMLLERITHGIGPERSSR